MPLPAPKPLDVVFHRLNELAISRKKPGDIESYQMEKELKDAIRPQPQNAYLGLALLASLNGDEELMRYNMAKAYPYCQGSYIWHYNFGVNLMRCGCPDEAIEQFKLSLNASGDIRPWLSDLAFYATILDDSDFSLQVLLTAKRLKVKNFPVDSLSIHSMVASVESDEEAGDILNNFITDEILRNESTPISDEELLEMQNLAKDLEKYL